MIPVDFTRISLMVVTTIFFSVLCRNEIEMETWKYYRQKQSNESDIDEDDDVGGNSDNYAGVQDDGVKS